MAYKFILEKSGQVRVIPRILNGSVVENNLNTKKWADNKVVL